MTKTDHDEDNNDDNENENDNENDDANDDDNATAADDYNYNDRAMFNTLQFTRLGPVNPWRS